MREISVLVEEFGMKFLGWVGNALHQARSILLNLLWDFKKFTLKTDEILLLNEI